MSTAFACVVLAKYFGSVARRSFSGARSPIARSQMGARDDFFKKNSSRFLGRFLRSLLGSLGHWGVMIPGMARGKATGQPFFTLVWPRAAKEFAPHSVTFSSGAPVELSRKGYFTMSSSTM